MREGRGPRATAERVREQAHQIAEKARGMAEAPLTLATAAELRLVLVAMAEAVEALADYAADLAHEREGVQ